VITVEGVYGAPDPRKGDRRVTDAWNPTSHPHLERTPTCNRAALASDMMMMMMQRRERSATDK
jgi:hypothetical protein